MEARTLQEETKQDEAKSARKLTAVIQWLEQNQPDVFRRGLWDCISSVE